MTTDKQFNPMDVMKPINLSSKELDESQPFTSVEIGWTVNTKLNNFFKVFKFILNWARVV